MRTTAAAPPRAAAVFCPTPKPCQNPQEHRRFDRRTGYNQLNINHIFPVLLLNLLFSCESFARLFHTIDFRHTFGGGEPNLGGRHGVCEIYFGNWGIFCNFGQNSALWNKIRNNINIFTNISTNISTKRRLPPMMDHIVETAARRCPPERVSAKNVERRLAAIAACRAVRKSTKGWPFAPCAAVRPLPIAPSAAARCRWAKCSVPSAATRAVASPAPSAAR